MPNQRMLTVWSKWAETAATSFCNFWLLADLIDMVNQKFPK